MNQKTLLWIVLGVVVLGTLAFMLLRGAEEPVDTEESGDMDQTEEMEGMEETQTRNVVLSAQNNSGQSGSVLLEDLGDGTTRVTVSATAVYDNPQPAHIHSGTCEDLGGVEYPLENVVDGASETVVEVSLDELTEGTFAVNLHRSAEQVSLYTSCGDI